jgi:hypothetical protein
MSKNQSHERPPKLTPEQIAKCLEQPIPLVSPKKMLHVEVSRRTFDAVKANPSELKLVAKDRSGNAVVERPHRMSEAEAIARNQEYLRNRQANVAFGSEFGRPPDQRWIERRHWNGEVRYVPDDGSRNEYVVSDYDIFAVLRRD